MLAVVCGRGDDAESRFGYNLACAYKMLGADVLLVDCADSTDPDANAGAGFSLAQALERRQVFDRNWLHSTDPVMHIPIISGSLPGRPSDKNELVELLGVLVRLYQVVIINAGNLREGRLLEELLTMSPAIYLLTSQARDAIRATNALLLQWDPARRWRDRVNLVVDHHDDRALPTVTQIAEATGVPGAIALPPPPVVDAPGGPPGTARIPWVIRAPEAGYSAVILNIAATSGVPRIEPPYERAETRHLPNKADLIRYMGASRVAFGLTMAFIAIAAPSLLGGDLMVLLGTKLNAITPVDLAWTSPGFDVLFLIVSATLTFFALRHFFRQDSTIFSQLKVVTEHAMSGIAFTDANANLRYANSMFRRLMDVSQSASENIRLDTLLASRLGGTDPRELMNSAGEGRATIRMKVGTERERLLSLTARRVSLVGCDLGWVINVQDITMERASRETSAISTIALEAAPDGMVVVDLDKPDGPMVYMNKACEDITGYRTRDMIGKSPRLLQGSDRLQPEILAMSRAVQLRKKVTVTLRNYRKDGSMFWNQVRLSPVLDQMGRATHYVAIMRDVTAQRGAADLTERLAYFDQLTQLPNRSRFRRLLDDLIASCDRQPVILARVAVQRLLDVNSSAGHAQGDALLVEVAARLRTALPDALLGRITGDEFGVAYAYDTLQPRETVLRALQDALTPRYDLPGIRLHISFAIGHTLIDGTESGVDAETAMRQASIATHEANSNGLGEIRAFDPATEESIRTRMRMSAELQQSLTSDHFEMHYQPKIDLNTGAMCGAEALIRWNHPVFGLQRPDKFIPLAEQTGLIIDLGAIAFTQTVKMAVAIHGSGQSAMMPLSVNVSVLQFRHPGLLDFFESTLARLGAKASWFTLELTESVFSSASAELLEKLHLLRGMGFGLSIDDFGTGYSSLRYLQQFPMTEIKLDRSFVTNLDQNVYGRSICEAILTIGKGLNVSVVAEGIETLNEKETLKTMGCHCGQGYLFSRPVEAKSFLAMARDQANQPWRKHFVAN